MSMFGHLPESSPAVHPPPYSGVFFARGLGVSPLPANECGTCEMRRQKLLSSRGFVVGWFQFIGRAAIQQS